MNPNQKASYLAKSANAGQTNHVHFSPVFLLASIIALNDRVTALATKLEVDPATLLDEPGAPAAAPVAAPAPAPVIAPPPVVVQAPMPVQPPIPPAPVTATVTPGPLG